MRTERINKILNHDLYKEYLWKNNKAEEERIYCKHDMSHFLDVARLALILNYQEGIEENQELLYGAALLHDIGRWMQYQQGMEHELASAELAPAILKESGFSAMEIERIVDAIRNHRNKKISAEPSLRGLLYRADKLSRPCFSCPAEEQCQWNAQKKNLKLIL